MAVRFATTVSAIAAAVLLSAGLARAQDNARGIAVYSEQKCSLCHSIGGKGNAKGPLDKVGSKLSADDIKAWITNPKDMAEKSKADRKPPMKAYSTLPAEDLTALVTYLQSLK